MADDVLLRLYHRTPFGKEIIAGGFRDGTGTYMTLTEHSGVWLADQPLNINDGADGDDVIEVVAAESAIADHEWVEEGCGSREWCIPAALVNEMPRRLMTEAEVDEVLDRLAEAREQRRLRDPDASGLSRDASSGA